MNIRPKFLCLVWIWIFVTPLQAQVPKNYYTKTKGLKGEELLQTLSKIISRDHQIITYGDTDEYMSVIDRVPQSNRIDLIYSQSTLPLNQFAGIAIGNVWNREHVWPRSRGLKPIPGAQSDIYNLYPCDLSVNSLRDRSIFDLSQNGQPAPEAAGSSFDWDSWEPIDEDKGRIARALLYMAVRYRKTTRNSPGLTLVENPTDGSGEMGKLSIILDWNRKFPPDQKEKQRNQQIYTGVKLGNGFTLKQGNRNPFIDEPLWADLIYLNPIPSTWRHWCLYWFSFEENQSPGLDGKDLDKDGLTNYTEFYLGSNPSSKSEPFLSVKKREGSQTEIRIQHRKNCPSHLQWQIYSTSQESWSPITPIEVQEIETRTGNPFGISEQIFTDEGTTPSKFRLLVTPKKEP